MQASSMTTECPALVFCVSVGESVLQVPFIPQTLSSSTQNDGVPFDAVQVCRTAGPGRLLRAG